MPKKEDIERFMTASGKMKDFVNLNTKLIELKKSRDRAKMFSYHKHKEKYFR